MAFFSVNRNDMNLLSVALNNADPLASNYAETEVSHLTWKCPIAVTIEKGKNKTDVGRLLWYQYNY